MIDFHTHILPNIDDGSSSIKESIQMIYEEINQGVDKICLTPHFYPEKISIDTFLNNRENSFNDLKYYLDKNIYTNLYLGAEVHYFEGIGNANKINKLCIQNTNNLLLELPFKTLNNEIINDIKNLTLKQNLNIILAHIERYYQIPGNKKYLNEIMSLPVIFQINSSSLLKNNKKEKIIKKLLHKNIEIILSSDCHNLINRPPNLILGYERIEELLPGFINNAKEIGERILYD